MATVERGCLAIGDITGYTTYPRRADGARTRATASVRPHARAAWAADRGGHRISRSSATARTVAPNTTVRGTLDPGAAWMRAEPSEGVAAALAPRPNPRGNRTTSSTNAGGLHSANTTVSGSAAASHNPRYRTSPGGPSRR